MSNVNRKAKGTTLVDRKLKKAQKRIELMGQQVKAAQMNMLNMRQLFEAATQEKQVLQDRLDQATQIITAVALQAKKQKLVIKESTFEKLPGYVGYDTEAEGEDLVLTPISREEFEAAMASEEEAQDE